MKKTRYVMGTFLSVQIMGEDPEFLQRVFLDEIQRLEGLLSIYRPESEISRINRAAGTSPVRVSPETYEIIDQALDYAALSGGAFDPTVQPLGYRKAFLDSLQHTVFLTEPGMKLDLGGIGKGFALDKALVRVREAYGAESVSADFGGQLFFWHKSGSFGPATIVTEDQAALWHVTTNCSISTSSNSERPAHLIDPRSGKPARGTASATVLAPTGTRAEALSTAVFVMGEQVGTHWLAQFPDVRAFILSHDSQN